ncbi:thioredoxin [Pontibacillus yanchengensis]|uniref:Thioredoxin n=2 Tax=Pontibacillus yanchengensis TaxID=462910 RepID=A0ACC7VGX8_9BACI|nr:thioredoxin family protein [Pontibacillus yanchengensis]MYL34907.1 thioredoxin [Pontibacillus yanchengensis]MYL54718.1 thioredoxin [Pontibacillus yanchengensis]
MKRAQSIEEVRSFVQQEDISLLYISRPNCSVCHSLLPQVEELLEDYQKVSTLYVDADEIPEIAGEYEIFTVPVLIVSVEGREMFRKARIVPIEELNQQLGKLYSAYWDEGTGSSSQ